MNDRIRFRVWDKTRKVMRHVITRIDWLIDGRPIRVHWCTSEIEDGIITGDESDDFGFILFHSTGLHDQGDISKEIFADDIIFFEGANCIVRQAKDGMWMLNNDKDKCGTSLAWAIEHHIEKITVIGDTMQNPKLVKGHDE